MTKSNEKQFLVTVTYDAVGGVCRTHVQNILGDENAVKNLTVESGEEFSIDTKTAMSVYSKSKIISRSAPAAATSAISVPRVQSPDSNVPMVAGAWGTMAGGWATLASRNGGVSIANHGNYSLDDGIARVAAGDIIPRTEGSSWTTLPGGWSALASGNIPTPHPSSTQQIALEPVPVAAVPSVAPANPAPVVAANNPGGAQTLLAWASMAGGWANLAKRVPANASTLVTQPVLTKTNQVAAGSIIANDAGNISQFPSWASMPGGWSRLKSI